ncbi:MAG: hypothetical protein IJU80_06630 [Lachnospiraceae bacterium]|nr:hypothetical protein [Lachnospiraceae bacterium]
MLLPDFTAIVLSGEGVAQSSSTLDNLFSVGQQLIGFAGQILNVVVENPLLSIPIVASLVGIGIGLIGSLRHAW